MDHPKIKTGCHPQNGTFNNCSYHINPTIIEVTE